VAPLALAIGEPSDGEQVGRLEEPNAVVEVEPEAGVDFPGDVAQAGAGETCLHRVAPIASQRQETPRI
jgi:hypothetical protein